MFAFVFVEIDTEKKPVYLEKCMTMLGKDHTRENLFFVTREYYEQMGQNTDAERVIPIPDELFRGIDENVRSAENRMAVLEIMKNEGITQWFVEKLRDKAVSGLILQRYYIALHNAAEALECELLIDTKGIQKITDNMKESVEQRARTDEELLHEKERNASLRNDIGTKDEYIQQLQVKINKLENKIYKMNSKLEQGKWELDDSIQKKDRVEKEKYLILRLYKEMIKELDSVKIELLELKKNKK